MAGFNQPQDDQEPSDAKVLYLTDDCIRLLEDEFWAELASEIAMGWKTPERASNEFLAWRAGYKVIDIAEQTGV